MDTYAALRDMLARDSFEETRGLEFKRGGRWRDVRHLVAKAALAMSNVEGGGLVVIGIDKDRSGQDRLAGMDEEASATFRTDDMEEFVNRYADPPVQIEVGKVSDGGRHFVVLAVHEFGHQPVLCTKSLDRDGKRHLEAGRLYYRPRGKAESTSRLAHHDMRELLDMAAAKRHNYWQRHAMGMGAGARIPVAPGTERGLGGGGILAAVWEKAHYAIAMRPRTPKNLPLGELEDVVRDCRVWRRKFPYPYVPSGRMERHEDCIGASHVGGLHADEWRLYRSGQFSERLGLYEARWPPNQPPSAGCDAPLRERFLEPALTLYQISEVFQFASRLARSIPDIWRIEIKLCDMQDRMLDIRVPERFGLYADYKCGVPEISLSAELDSWSLQARYADLAIEKALEVMDCFGWSEKSMESSFRREQERLYRWGETKSMPVPISC